MTKLLDIILSLLFRDCKVIRTSVAVGNARPEALISRGSEAVTEARAEPAVNNFREANPELTASSSDPASPEFRVL